ncbi:hypothetical protein DENSPDRAFT_845395 [Dentipellis sp. KUC8613]|nr:hypothetical protein DENSPDRAFT_845395 [Dentipellis sp. KUC8613]
MGLSLALSHCLRAAPRSLDAMPRPLRAVPSSTPSGTLATPSGVTSGALGCCLLPQHPPAPQ